MEPFLTLQPAKIYAGISRTLLREHWETNPKPTRPLRYDNHPDCFQCSSCICTVSGYGTACMEAVARSPTSILSSGALALTPRFRTRIECGDKPSPPPAAMPPSPSLRRNAGWADMGRRIGTCTSSVHKKSSLHSSLVTAGSINALEVFVTSKAMESGASGTRRLRPLHYSSDAYRARFRDHAEGPYET